MTKTVRTAVPNTIDRWFPASAYADLTRVLDASGVVDHMMCWDQLTYFWPPMLWNEANSPLTKAIPDLDSFRDVFAMSAFAHSTAPNLGTAISTDAIRRGPAELYQTMLTLADIKQGNIMFQLGAGEVKQSKPFGWRRSEGLQKFEDLFKIFDRFWESDGPIDFDGNVWKLDHAWIGGAKEHKPEVWGLGGGPKILDLATTYADGFATDVPGAFWAPEDLGAEISRVKEQLERKGRDPEKFGFGVWAMSLLHDDPGVIEQVLDNPLMRWYAATAGRLKMSDWDHEGIEPAFPRDWFYALKMLPTKYTRTEVEDILGRTTREMCSKSFLHGTAQQVAAQLQEYVDVGVTWVAIVDLVPLMLDVTEAQSALQRSIDVCAHLKGA